MLVRLSACPSFVEFWKDVKNLVDVAAVLPFYLDLLVQKDDLNTTEVSSGPQPSSLTVTSLSFLRIIRLVRVFKLTKHFVGLQVI